MATITRHLEMSSSSIFNNDDLPAAGFPTMVLTVITRPFEFFSTLRAQQVSQRTLWATILILGILAFHALQIDEASTAAQPALAEFVSDESAPFDPGFPPDNGGGGVPEAGSTDPVAKWMIAVSAVGRQVITWFALTLLLAEVTMFNGHMPQLGKNLQIVIWSTVPLALMALLQVIFITGGGRVSASGFSGFLIEWSRFPSLNIYLQSFIHALASQLTLFSVWSLWLLYLGARLTLRGKHLVIILVITIWILMIGVAYSFKSYDALKANDAGNVEEMIVEQIVDDTMVSGDLEPDAGTDSESNQPIEQIETVGDGQ